MEVPQYYAAYNNNNNFRREVRGWSIDILLYYVFLLQPVPHVA